MHSPPWFGGDVAARFSPWLRAKIVTTQRGTAAWDAEAMPQLRNHSLAIDHPNAEQQQNSMLRSPSAASQFVLSDIARNCATASPPIKRGRMRFGIGAHTSRPKNKPIRGSRVMVVSAARRSSNVKTNPLNPASTRLFAERIGVHSNRRIGPTRNRAVTKRTHRSSEQARVADKVRKQTH